MKMDAVHLRASKALWVAREARLHRKLARARRAAGRIVTHAEAARIHTIRRDIAEAETMVARRNRQLAALRPEKARLLYAQCKHISDQARRYSYGGGHGRLSDIHPHDGLDCSSSTSLALHRAGMFPDEYAWVSGKIAAEWGVPGRGRYFTVWANSYHVWIQFHGLGRFWRFDTSPWGYGGLGPRMRMTPRLTRNFTPRHWPGL